MFDPDISQGAGLHAIAATPAPRIVALASYGNRQAELSLLWSLCSAWADLDYTVLVLDVTVAESEAQPGLLQLLANQHRVLDAQTDGVAWPIVPAARGFSQLCQQALPGTRPSLADTLGQLFGSHEVVLVYADAAALTAAFADSALQPLLTLSASPVSTLPAYRALKLMLINGRLEPTIVASGAPSEPTSMPPRHDLSASLQDCAQAFLGRRLTTLKINPRREGADVPYDDIHRLALRLLENALLPQRPPHSAPAQRTMTHEDSLARTH